MANHSIPLFPLPGILSRLSNTSQLDACWEWQGTRSKRGYGLIRQRGRIVYAHRVSYATFIGELPPGVIVCHHCDNPSCCNPSHLFAGSPLDNARDRDTKGRSGTLGERCVNAKVTADDVVFIRQMIDAGRMTRLELSRQFGITHGHVSRIYRREVWAHIPDSQQPTCNTFRRLRGL